jgi:hypothetical protein
MTVGQLPDLLAGRPLSGASPLPQGMAEKLMTMASA